MYLSLQICCIFNNQKCLELCNKCKNRHMHAYVKPPLQNCLQNKKICVQTFIRNKTNTVSFAHKCAFIYLAVRIHWACLSLLPIIVLFPAMFNSILSLSMVLWSVFYFKKNWEFVPFFWRSTPKILRNHQKWFARNMQFHHH